MVRGSGDMARESGYKKLTVQNSSSENDVLFYFDEMGSGSQQRENLPPRCSISAGSKPSLNALCYLLMVESCKISFWKASFNRAIISTFDFFNLM